MQALISPNEKAYDYMGNYLGSRVAEVSETPFPVASPLFWCECPVDCSADQWYYLDGGVYPKPVPPPEPEPEQPAP